MNWILLVQIAYVSLVFLVILRVLYDTRSSTKALAYILFIVFVPIIGMVFYFSFGINYRKRKMYTKKLIKDEAVRKQFIEKLNSASKALITEEHIPINHHNLARLLLKSGNSPITADNKVKLLINGEEKFPELIQALDTATSHIHVEYYIYEDDVTGNAVADILMQKARQGVTVRFMYDDFGSHGLDKKFITKLTDAGVQTVPFYRVKLWALANRLNYRNHRKIVIIDGKISFVGGINMSDTYRNDLPNKNSVYWRDTHLQITGGTTIYLQHLFICDWNFATKSTLSLDTSLFPKIGKSYDPKGSIVQIAASGPDSDIPLIFYSLLNAILSATTQILITSPYFIPGESLMDALIIAVESGVKVQILVPKKSDSKLVNSAAYSYYTELVPHGVEIFFYKKGFVHAKTMVIDNELAVIGSANMDYRSFDLNFEVNVVLYDVEITNQLTKAFLDDKSCAEQLDKVQWMQRSRAIRLWEKIVRLLSPFL